MQINFDYKITGIGSVPFLDIEESCSFIKESFSEIPFWPQLVGRSVFEDMIIQFSERLPFLKVIKEERRLIAIKGDSPEKELTDFYEHFFEEDTHWFLISEDYAPGLYRMTDIVKDSTAHFIKGQSVGPVTFTASIKGEDGRSALTDPELIDVYTKGIAIKGLWQVRKLKESGKKVILFLDEPYLATLGSAFSIISKDKVIEMLKEVIDYIKQREDVIVGIHCCANTDWSAVMSAKPDIISFDAFGYMNNFLLYKDKIFEFLKEGAIAWGIVPTTDEDFEKRGSLKYLLNQLRSGIEKILDWGIRPEDLASRSLITPSCGMGTMNPDNAKKAVEVLLELSSQIKVF